MISNSVTSFFLNDSRPVILSLCMWEFPKKCLSLDTYLLVWLQYHHSTTLSSGIAVSRVTESLTLTRFGHHPGFTQGDECVRGDNTAHTSAHSHLTVTWIRPIIHTWLIETQMITKVDNTCICIEEEKNKLIVLTRVEDIMVFWRKQSYKSLGTFIVTQRASISGKDYWMTVQLIKSNYSKMSLYFVVVVTIR